MALSDLLVEMQRRQQSSKDKVHTLFASAGRAQESLRAELSRAEARTSAREVSREARIIKQVDPEQIRRTCDAGRAHELSKLEQKVVIAQFAAFGARVVKSVIDAFPHLRSRYSRRLLRDWGVQEGGEQWDRLVAAGSFGEADVGIRGLPLKGAAALASDAPTRLASIFKTGDVGAVLETLVGGGVRADGPFAASCVLAWIEKRRGTGWNVSEYLQWVLKTPSIRTQLVPRVADRNVRGAVDPRHPAAFTALVLGAHREGRVSEPEYEAFVAILTDPRCEFGDPRVEVSKPWGQIKQQEPAGYQALVERLNSEDLRFFFDKTMEDATDRREFWLGYLKSIRRTHCVLDRKSAAKIQQGLSLQPERLQNSYRRAGRFTGNTDVSAFCLWFDSHVIVEFSKTANAVYVYTTANFEKHVRPHLVQPGSASALKDADVALAWNHNENWERRFRDRLNDLGIWAR